MNEFVDKNKDRFEKEKNDRLNIAEKVAMTDIAKGLTREQAKVILKQLPIDMIYNELGERLTCLCDFKSKFDDLALIAKKM